MGNTWEGLASWESDAPGPCLRRCDGSPAVAGRSPPGQPSSPEASRKPVPSQTSAPSLEGRALVQISKQSTCAFLLRRSGEELLRFETLNGEKEKEKKRGQGKSGENE